MIKSISISAVILLCCALIESAILSNIAFLRAVPDLSLICVLYFSLHNGRVSGECTGFISGLFIDFLSAAPFGLNCLFRTVLGYLGGVFTKTFNTDGIIIPAVLGFCATIIKCLFIRRACFHDRRRSPDSGLHGTRTPLHRIQEVHLRRGRT